MPFLSNSENDILQMLQVIGVDNVEKLLKNIPSDIRFRGKLDIPEPISEIEVTSLIEKMGKKNTTGISFMGGGAYDHYVPAVVDAIVTRPEFYTAYTPYQPEVSQGTLQAIYEFQSMICELTGMDVTNASMYEGGSALAEAMLLACSHTGKSKILFAGSLNPRYKAVLKTYVRHNEIELIEIPLSGFRIDLSKIDELLTDEIAAVIIQHPNYFGCLEDVFEINSFLEKKNALFITFYDPISLGILAPPGEYGADIAIAEGQSLGNYQNFGGPFIGLFSAHASLVRKMPGRIVGKTTDMDGKMGFVLTLQTREQHIRREKATSNICTNSGLLALAATVYLALMGKNGIRKVANLCFQKSHYIAEKLIEIPGVQSVCPNCFFKEFMIELPVKASSVLDKLKNQNILGGISLETLGYANHLLIAVTEKRSKNELDYFVKSLHQIITG